MRGKRTTSSNQVGEPCDDDGGTVWDLQEGEKREDHHDSETVDWYTLASSVGKDARGTTFQCQTVECTDGTVEVSVAGRENGSEQETRCC